MGNTCVYVNIVRLFLYIRYHCELKFIPKKTFKHPYRIIYIYIYVYMCV